MQLLQPEYSIKSFLVTLKTNELEKFKSQLKTLPEFRDDLRKSSCSEVDEADGIKLADILIKKFPSNRLKLMTLTFFNKIKNTESSQPSEGQTLETDDSMLVDTKSSKTEELDMKDIWEAIINEFSIWEKDVWIDDYDHFHDVIQRNQKLIPSFNPKMDTKQRSNTVVLYGYAGVGKTTVVKSCLQEWTKGCQGQEIQYAFYLQCREFNHMGFCSFSELISKNSSEWKTNDVEVLTKTENVLVVVDGFDELRVPVEALISECCSDWDTQTPAPILLSSLLKRKLIPKATLLVTTQPHALQELMLLVKQPFFVEIKGFLAKDKERYFLNHLRVREQAFQALYAVKCNVDLFHMASAPTVCSIICTYLKLQMTKEEDLAVHCQTCTSLFLQFLCSQFSPRSYVYNPNGYGKVLQALCILAAQNLWTQQATFHREELWSLGLKESDLSPFLDMHILQEYCDSGNCYSFIHLCIQQLLAAMLYILKFQDEGDREDCKRNIGNVRKLFSREARFYNPNLIQAGLFLFGLLNQKQVQDLETTFGCETSMEIKWELLKILQGKSEERKPFFSVMSLKEIFLHLYESQEGELVKEAMAPFAEISLCFKSNIDILHSAFCIKYCTSLQKLSLQVAKGIFLENDDELNSYLRGVRVWAASNSLSLWIHLCSVICSNKNLSILDITQSFLSDCTLRILCHHITDVSCCLQRVIMRDVSPPTAYRDVCLALVGKKTLTHLILTGSVQEKNTGQLMFLGEMLRHWRCNLQFLRLGSCYASIRQWNDFFFTFNMNQSLRCVDFSNNKLLAKSVKSLCMNLRSIKRVSLENCQLKETCCKDISSLLMVSQKLTHLSLSKNNLGDDGVKILCRGLNSPKCKLQMLVIQQCGVTAHGCKHISEMLCEDSNLTHLDMGLNSIANGVMFLCNTIKNPKCSLKCLGLWGCSFSPLYCEELAAAIASNKKLETLDLGQNILGKSGVVMILKTLSDNNGPLKTIRRRYFQIFQILQYSKRIRGHYDKRHGANPHDSKEQEPESSHCNYKRGAVSGLELS
ncbi:NACHT, LRR and PYD domains-containing protein 7-like [Grammomys surdaster]|uniref:NACHT, LRR and PYD domains-containing protein 7-like n=1 Tax=Grammomys surdaster TaxID=491861 RepID=UPI0010A0AFF1|nr:NACHT, LRR and PYD domains-containing protein 7-like [Grammomys surdaster]